MPHVSQVTLDCFEEEFFQIPFVCLPVSETILPACQALEWWKGVEINVRQALHSRRKNVRQAGIELAGADVPDHPRYSEALCFVNSGRP